MATELRYGKELRFIGHLPDGETYQFSEEDVRENRLSTLIPHDGEPGAKTLWLGLQEIAIFVKGACYARELSETGTCV